MTARRELRQLYNKRLKPKIRVLEREQRKIKNKILITFIVYLTLNIILFYSFSQFWIDATDGSIVFVAITFFLLTFFFIASFSFFSRSYRKRFKDEVVKEIFMLFIEDVEFIPESYIPEMTFQSSQLLSDRYNRYVGEDFVKGRVGDIKLEFSELRVERTTRRGKEQVTESVFNGLFFKYEFNKAISNPILVHADKAHRLVGKMFSKFLQRISKPKYSPVNLESIEFEKMFAVYCDDQIQARVILNPLTMDKMVKFQNRYKELIELSLIDNCLYLIVHTRKNHFEPKIFGKVVSWKEITEIFDLIDIVKSFVAQLNLNVRIRR